MLKKRIMKIPDEVYKTLNAFVYWHYIIKK